MTPADRDAIARDLAAARLALADARAREAEARRAMFALLGDHYGKLAAEAAARVAELGRRAGETNRGG